MATCTPYTATNDSSNVTSYVLTAFTPAVNELLIVFIYTATSVHPTAAAAMTDDRSGTYHLADAALRGASGATLYVFVRNQLVSSAVAHTLTFTCTGDAAQGVCATPYGVSGMSKTGSTAVRQTAKQENQGAAATPAPVFSVAALTGNPTLGAVANITAPPILTPPTSWTEDFDTGFSTPTGSVEAVHRDSGFTGTTITWGSTSASTWCSLAIELDTSTLAKAPPPFQPITRVMIRR